MYLWWCCHDTTSSNYNHCKMHPFTKLWKISWSQRKCITEYPCSVLHIFTREDITLTYKLHHFSKLSVDMTVFHTVDITPFTLLCFIQAPIMSVGAILAVTAISSRRSHFLEHKCFLVINHTNNYHEGSQIDCNSVLYDSVFIKLSVDYVSSRPGHFQRLFTLHLEHLVIAVLNATGSKQTQSMP